MQLPGLPFDGDRVLDSTAALFLDRVPGRLAVVGGGYIGVELGTAWAKLGADVVILEAEDRLLPGMPRSLGRVVQRELDGLGVRVVTGAVVEGLEEDGLRVREDSGTTVLAADRVVVAVGRRPNTDDLGLDRVGVDVDDRGLVRVEPSRRAAGRILAIGDVTPGPALAHKAFAEAEVAALTAAGKPAAFDPAAIPAVVFSDPEVVTVGLTADEADELGAGPRTFTFPLSAAPRAQVLGRPQGHVELVADDQGTVLGVHMVGAGVAELAGEAALAVESAVTVEDLAGTIHPHPTMSEAVAEAAWGLLGQPLHTRRGRR